MLISARAVISASFVAFLGAGCRQQASPPPPASNSVMFETAHGVPKPPDSVAPADAQPVAPDPAKAVAQRAASFANSMEPQTSRRLTQSRAGDPDWPDPDAMKLTAQTSAPAVAEDAVAMAASPNAGIAVAIANPKPHDVVEAVPHPQPSPVPVVASDGLPRQLSQRAKDYPRDLSAQIDDQLMRYLKEEPVPDLQAVSELPAEDRELLSALMDSLTNFRNQLRSDNNMLFSRKIRPLLDLSDRLRSQAELSVPRVALCTRVTTYGVYDAIEPARFIAGKPQRSVIYCEVENFFSQLNDKKLYETRLAEDVVLYQESTGLEVWREDRKTYTDQSHNRRHDFFVGHIITLPSNLTINRYLLKVTIEDLAAHHVAENTVPIEIVAQ